MVQRLFDADPFEFFGRAVQERAAGCGQDHLFDRRMFAGQALENGRMFRVDRNDRSPVFGGQPGDDLSGHDQALLVGQRDFFAVFQRADRREQPAVTDQGHDDRVDLFRADDLFERIAARVYFDRMVRQRVSHGGIMSFVGDHHVVGGEFDGLFDQLFPVAVGRQRRYFEPVAVSPDDIERLGSDRTGRAENG